MIFSIKARDTGWRHVSRSARCTWTPCQAGQTTLTLQYAYGSLSIGLRVTDFLFTSSGNLFRLLEKKTLNYPKMSKKRKISKHSKKSTIIFLRRFELCCHIFRCCFPRKIRESLKKKKIAPSIMTRTKHVLRLFFSPPTTTLLLVRPPR